MSSDKHTDENEINQAEEVHADDIEFVDETSTEKSSTAAEEAAKWKNDYLYLKAEFENFKKQSIKERSQLIKYGAERLITELLDVLDNFDRALNVEVSQDNLESYKRGIELTASELVALLGRFGVQPIESEGQPFNPQLHEALSSEETDQVPPGHISQVFKKAYKLHDKVIRPAQVVVAKEPSSEDGESGS